MPYKFEFSNPKTREIFATKDFRTAYRIARRVNREARHDVVTHITNIETGRVYMINYPSENRNVAHGRNLADKFHGICHRLMEYEHTRNKIGLSDFALEMLTAGILLM